MARATSLPSTSESRQGLAILNRQFPATAQAPIYLLVQTTDGSSMLTAENH